MFLWSEKPQFTRFAKCDCIICKLVVLVLSFICKLRLQINVPLEVKATVQYDVYDLNTCICRTAFLTLDFPPPLLSSKKEKFRHFSFHANENFHTHEQKRDVIQGAIEVSLELCVRT